MIACLRDIGQSLAGILVDELSSQHRVTITPLVHLIVWTQRRTPALGSRAAALGNALATVCQDVIGVREVPSLLHVQAIDDNDMQNLFGARRRDLWTIRLQAYLLAMQEPVEEL